jgi:hypothetical protein
VDISAVENQQKVGKSEEKFIFLSCKEPQVRRFPKALIEV